MNARLTEQDLDSHNAEFHPLPSLEQEHPMAWLLYAVGIVAGAAASALLPIWEVAPK
jgi:4-hydroxybenzoate polyprenyltransferase